MKTQTIFYLALVLFLSACTGGKVVQTDEDLEYRDLDTLVITPDKDETEEEYTLEKYNPSHTRTHDLIHTSLDVRFDWSKQHLLGKAELTLVPYFYTTNEIVLDAKSFDFHKVQLVDARGTKELDYDYDGEQITINLGRQFTSKDQYKLFIDYTAKPNERKAGGSAAISSDKGLYFINPLKEDPTKPQQIWTQGETESSSCWFPTIDKPNERCTQEISITVQDKFQTLSNGVMTSSKKNSDGTRTDSYKMEQPHAPYLFMMAVGEFAVVRDTWEGIPVEYFVEKEYEDSAEEIFAHTKEMLTFFSDLLGYKYPWPKYSQIVVRDYVSGAMENTTGVIFGEFVQKHKRELIDGGNERIVAHELFHHWFGDLVTCESWSNLPLNEAFANYSEYLWFEHKHGKDEADYHRLNEMNGYIRSAGDGGHDLIWYDFNDKEQMFDAHSYNKGGCILHMLRNYVGKEAFFEGFRHYLSTNEYSDVEAHELRLAFEDVTGEDLNWFFNQWFFSSGHPVLEVTHNYNATTKKLEVMVEQKQNAKKHPPIFVLPVAIDVHTNGEKVRHEVTINERKQTFTFDNASAPDWVNVDGDRMLLAEISYPKKSLNTYMTQYNSAEFLDRYDAIQFLKGKEGDGVNAVVDKALKDKSWVIRRNALNGMNNPDPAMVANMAKNDKRSQVRASALKILGKIKDPKYASVCKDAIEKDQAYRCVGAGLKALNAIDKNEGLAYAKKMENESNGSIMSAVGELYSTTGDKKYMGFFENNWDKFSGFQTFSFFEGYTNLVKACDVNTGESAVNKLKDVSLDMGKSPFHRYSSTVSLNSLKKDYAKRAKNEEDATKKAGLEGMVVKIKALMEKIKEKETNSQLKQFYNSL